MKRLIRWLETKIAAPANSGTLNGMSNTVSVEPGDVSTTSGGEVPGRPCTAGSEKDISMPDIYADSDVVTEPDLKILQQPSADGDKSVGFNPYDTGVLQKK